MFNESPAGLKREAAGIDPAQSVTLEPKRLTIAIALLLLRPLAGAAAPAAWAQDALKREAGYIVNCSFTELAKNHQEVQPSDDAYGALNVNRIYQRGADWVVPGEAAMGVIGLMAAAAQLKASGETITTYDQVLDRFFRSWLLERKQPVEMDAASPDAGGCFERVYYDTSGKWQRHDPARSSVTGQMIAAMWKYSEYQTATGDPQAARRWLEESWPIAQLGGDFIRRHLSKSYKLVRSNSRSRDLWISDSAYSAMALRCLAKWVVVAEKTPSFDYGALADGIVNGIQALKDPSARKSFFRFRSSKSAAHKPTYGDRIDQLCFLPYEADVLDPGERFAKSLSDWWTNGSSGIRMTYRAADPKDWRYYGAHWRYFFTGPAKSRAEYRNLYPGPGLQLAKVEWKHAHKTGDRVTAERARRRLEWCRSPAYSNLWLGATGTSEADVPDGVVDWRDATRYTHKADDWDRFVDTSAYFIEVVLMVEYGVDTRYVPDR